MDTSFKALPDRLQVEAERAAIVLAEIQRLPQTSPSASSASVGTFDTQKKEAINLFIGALSETITYMKKLKDGSAKNVQEEVKLYDLWSAAGQSATPINPGVAHQFFMEGLGWLDPDVWERAEKSGLKIDIPDLEKALQLLLKTEEPPVFKPWFPIAGVCFAAAAVLFLMYMIVAGPSSLDPDRKNMLIVLISFCLAASGAFIGGDAAAKGKIPFFENSPIAFTAAGGVGIFVVAFLLLRYTM